jgi:pimeloyl-ACP methyl ester carboxylesterase
MHFVLVHGAYHGAWCWDALREELDLAGHSTTAVGLPIEDPDAGAERYADEIVASAPKNEGPVALLGHSLAGLTIPIVAGRIRTAITIYLAALLPVPGLSFDAQRAGAGTGFVPSVSPAVGPNGGSMWPEQGAIEIFFHDCDREVAIRSASQLRSQQWLITQEVTPLREWPAVPSAYILCSDDRVVSRAYSVRAARDLLGVDPTEIPGGHAPFLSRPAELAARLDSLVTGVA